MHCQVCGKATKITGLFYVRDTKYAEECGVLQVFSWEHTEGNLLFYIMKKFRIRIIAHTSS